MPVRRIAYDSRAFWELFAPFASAAVLGKAFPTSVGGLSTPGWKHCIRRAQAAFPDLAWYVTTRGCRPPFTAEELPEPVYEDEVERGVVAPVAAQMVEWTTAEKIERDMMVKRLQMENRDLKDRYSAVIGKGALHEAVLEAVSASLPTIAARKPKPGFIRLSDSKTTEDAILGWADPHGGERVSGEVMGGLNRYGPVETCRRLQYTVDKTLSLLLGNHSGTRFEKLYVFDLGDNVTGDLLDDNKATNAMGVFDSFRFMAEIKARALTELSEHLPVVYVSVPGNHGRRGNKMPWKQPTETADWLIAEMVRLHCRGNDRIEFVVPRAWSAVVEIRGHKHWVNHGYAAAKGGNGGIPWYAYMRRDGKMTAIDATRGERIRYRWYGHIHTQAEIPKMGGSGEQFIIGSLKGGDEYALNELGEYGDPVQKLVGCSEKYGVTFRYPLDVKHGDDAPSRYEDAIGPLLR